MVISAIKKKKNDEKEGKLKNILGKKSVFLNKEKIKKSKTASDPQYTWGMFLYHFGICLVRHEAGKKSQLRDIFVLMYYIYIHSRPRRPTTDR